MSGEDSAYIFYSTRLSRGDKGEGGGKYKGSLGPCWGNISCRVLFNLHGHVR